MAFRRWPFELETLLCNRLHPRSATSFLRYSSSSITFPPHQLATAAKQAQLPNSQAISPFAESNSLTSPEQSENLFEQISTEYAAAPPSTLDFPAPPRSPDDALLALLTANQFEEADILLRDLKKSGQTILPNYAFAEHAYRLFRGEIVTSSSSASSSKNNLDVPATNWLEWWSLAPSLTARSEKDSFATAIPTRRMNSVAHKMMQSLVSADFSDWSTIRKFGILLAEQGLTRPVAQNLLVHSAAYGPITNAGGKQTSMAEELFEACLTGLNEQLKQVRKLTAAVVTPRCVSRLQARKFGLSSWRHARLKRRVDYGQLKLVKILHFDARYLMQSRSEMLRVYANLGKLESVLEILERMQKFTNFSLLTAGGKLKMGKKTFIYLLNHAAKLDQFDLFNRLYEIFREGGARLTRIHSNLNQGPKTFPYFARAIHSQQSDKIPSAPEAFTTFKYSNYVGALEEGEENPQEAEREDLLNSLKSALEQKNLESATQILLRLFAAGNSVLPHVSAQWIELAQAQNQFELVNKISAHFCASNRFKRNGKTISSRLARHWAAARMLAAVHTKNAPLALTVFEHTFERHGLPPVVQKAFNAIVRDAQNLLTESDRFLLSNELNPREERKRLVLDSYTFSIALEAAWNLMRRPENVNAAIVSEQTMNQIYRSLLEQGVNILPQKTRSAQDFIGCPLDSMIFVPYLQFFSRSVKPPNSLLSVLIDMQNLNLSASAHHYAAILHAFARKAPPEDAFYLLDYILSQPYSGAPPSQELYALTKLLKIIKPEPGKPSNVGLVGYTGMISGFTKRGELQAAKMVVQRMRENSDWSVWEKDFRLKSALIELNRKLKMVTQ